MMRACRSGLGCQGCLGRWPLDAPRYYSKLTPRKASLVDRSRDQPHISPAQSLPTLADTAKQRAGKRISDLSQPAISRHLEPETAI